ncbi:MAG: TonB-dependent receptor [Proteobacteria bacterium]|nr:TonB-dependent receptor [Pseudomonadota bacterium]
MRRPRPVTSGIVVRQALSIGAATLCQLAAALPGMARAAGNDGSTLPEVVVAAPLPGADLSLTQVPANVQRVTAGQLDGGRTHGVADALNQLVGSVNTNDTQANPFQPDINFRGFTGSPILGTPQGVSVFVDGVRVNEAFGDAVNWELIPQSAISGIEVTPGSNPVFGLNTLGGAVVVTTKRGFDSGGSGVQWQGGSFGRRELQADSGGHGERLDWYVAGTVYDDDGWADHNPSRVRQGFGKVGYRDRINDMTLSLTWADSSLQGNQTLPRSFLDDPLQAYTWPDAQDDSTVLLNLNASHRLGQDWTLAEQLYYRKVSSAIVNSNVNNDFNPSMPVAAGNEPTGNAIEQIDQYRPGAALQLSGHAAVAGHRNTLVAGLAWDRGATNFWQYSQEAGASRDTFSTAPPDLHTRLHASSRSAGIYVTDTFGISERLFLNLAGRYNDARVMLQDRLGAALNGRHSFTRFNPAVGLTFSPSRALTLYGRYEEGMRTPTPVELTCADPGAPCSLPNAFAADPPLRPVIAKTFEAGARGTLGGHASFTAAVFRTNLDNDIQFVSAGGGAVGAGYFRNVGQTRRQGVELGLTAGARGFSVSAHYTWLRATFQAPLVLNSPDNSAAAPISCAACTEIRVLPGDRMPGIPGHVFKLRTQYEAGRFGLGVTALAQSSQFARGDECNQDVNGPLPGYLLVNLDAHFDFSTRWSLFARIDNVFERRYYTFGTLGENVFTAPGDSFDATATSWRAEQFRSVGVPRGAWLGVSYRTGAAHPPDAP